MKKLTITVLCFALTISCLGIIVACDETHEHTYAQGWEYDESYHWHSATCEHINERSNYNAHIYDGSGKCTVCEYQPPIEEHQHTFAKEWTFDDEYHWHVATCEHTTEVDSKANHTPNDLGKCTVCGHQGDITFSGDEIDADAWAEAFEALEKTNNFSISLKMERDDVSMIHLIEIMENMIHVLPDLQGDGKDTYAIFTEDGMTTYMLYYGVWVSEFEEDVTFDEFLQERVFGQYVKAIVDGVGEMFDAFTYDEGGHAFIGEIDNDGVLLNYEVKFVGKNIYSVKLVTDGELATMYYLYDVNNTSFEFMPNHKHEFSNVWSNNNVYHWHDAVCHEGEVDVKVAHTWGSDNKCAVCGCAKVTPTNSEVDQDMFEKALQFNGITNWTVENYIDGELAHYIKCSSGMIQMLDYTDTYYFEIVDDIVWVYLKVSEGVWEKIANYDEMTPEYIEMEINFKLYCFGVLAEYWCEFEYIDGVYVANGLDLRHSLGTYYNNVTSTIVFEDGEVVSISMLQINSDSTDDIRLSAIGYTTVTLPNASVHSHIWSEWEVTDSGHSRRCSVCYEYDGGYHDYTDLDTMCSVCGVKNHEHVYDHYKPSLDNTDYHLIVCECGVSGHILEWHEFVDGSTICSKCGATKHIHTWVYTGVRDEYFHRMKCTDCGKIDSWQRHDYEENSPCSVCGYYIHDHQWTVVGQGDIDTHKTQCSICDIASSERHYFETGDVCSKCGAAKHYHDWQYDEHYSYSDKYVHQLYCFDCGSSNYENHIYADSNFCDVCGYQKAAEKEKVKVYFSKPVQYTDIDLNYYGDDLFVFNPTLGQWVEHKAVDLRAPERAEVVAMFDGLVIKVDESEKLGVFVVIDHGEGVIITYASLTNIQVVEGQKVNRGEMLGEVGLTLADEADNGTHLHLAIAVDGIYVDPMPYVNGEIYREIEID